MTTESFRTLGLAQPWLENLDNLGYETMTPIQQEALPALLAGRDLIGHASTGTGKTAAFGLALLQKVTPASQLPSALVLCPTRELAAQVAEEIRRLAWALPNTNVVTVCGGEVIRHQLQAIANGVDVIVGTPGRVLDHISRGTLDLSKVATLVLDEADRMLEMGFIDDVAKIIKETPEGRQTVMMSATIDSAVREVSRRFQRDAELVSVVAEEPEPDITQLVYDVGPLTRIDALQRVLSHHKPDSAVIFCNERATCDEVVSALRRAGHSAQTIHGGLEQRDRDDVLVMFSNGSLRLMVATNVAARGIDIAALDAVINYELPFEANAYVHRIGRTGRAGEEGLAISLVDSSERGRLGRYDEDLAWEDRRSVEELPEPVEPTPASKRTIVIQGGRKEKLRPGDIVGAFTGDFGISGDAIGDITIKDKVAFVAIDAGLATEAIRAIETGTIKGRNFNAFLLG